MSASPSRPRGNASTRPAGSTSYRASTRPAIPAELGLNHRDAPGGLLQFNDEALPLEFEVLARGLLPLRGKRGAEDAASVEQAGDHFEARLEEVQFGDVGVFLADLLHVGLVLLGLVGKETKVGVGEDEQVHVVRVEYAGFGHGQGVLAHVEDELADLFYGVAGDAQFVEVLGHESRGGTAVFAAVTRVEGLAVGGEDKPVSPGSQPDDVGVLRLNSEGINAGQEVVEVGRAVEVAAGAGPQFDEEAAHAVDGLAWGC